MIWRNETFLRGRWAVDKGKATHIISNENRANSRLFSMLCQLLSVTDQNERTDFRLNWIYIPILRFCFRYFDAFAVLPMRCFMMNSARDKCFTAHSLCANFWYAMHFQTDVMPRFEKYIYVCIPTWKKHSDNLGKKKSRSTAVHSMWIDLSKGKMHEENHIATCCQRLWLFKWFSNRSAYWVFFSALDLFPLCVSALCWTQLFASRISYRSVIYEMCDLWISST